MSEKYKVLIDFILEMRKCSLDDYQEIKMILLICNRDKPRIANFLNAAFHVIESEKPLLIEMDCSGRS